MNECDLIDSVNESHRWLPGRRSRFSQLLHLVTSHRKDPPVKPDHERSFGVFKPVDHLVISFPGEAEANSGQQALHAAGVTARDVRRYTDRQMIEQIDADVAAASPVAAVGQELNLVLAHRALAEQGYHFLVVRAEDDARARQLADLARDHGALRAQLYGHFIVEELIERPGQLPQVGESPDRGLDAQTLSGLEVEAGAGQRSKQAASRRH